MILSRNTAGSPTNPESKWTHLKPSEISRIFKEEYAQPVSNQVVKRLLKKHGYGCRKFQKQLATGSYARRDEQFKIIFHLIALMQQTNGPIISIDTKKKERLGNLYRAGKCYCTEPIKVFDHDYPHLAEGKVIPHGIFDLKQNRGYITIGTSHETAAFIADNIFWWWTIFGIHQYPDAQQILILCDAGGANGYRKHVFKKELLSIAREIGIRLIVCHYPPYCSKWNPIEHRLFCHVHRAMQGALFTSYEFVKELISKTKNSKGLFVIARIVKFIYPIGLKTDKSELDFNRILFHLQLPDLNYTILP